MLFIGKWFRYYELIIANCVSSTDSDELFFCPQADESIEAQRKYHQSLHLEFRAKGIEEMRYIRIPYSGL